jgi:hypothetical protein
VEFAAATLDAETDPVRQIELLRELQQEGIDYVPVDPNRSTDRWVPVTEGNQRKLIGPLTAIKNIGPAKAAKIIACRRTGACLPDSLMETLTTARTQIDRLYPVTDRIAALYPEIPKLDGKTVQIINLPDGKKLPIRSKPRRIRDVQTNGNDYEVMIIGVVKKIAPKDENEAVNVAKRGGRVYSGPHYACNLFFVDDSDQILARINRFNYDLMAKEIIERGGVGRALYAVKGMVPRNFRMIDISTYKFLGYMDDLDYRDEGGGTQKDNAYQNDVSKRSNLNA